MSEKQLKKLGENIRKQRKLRGLSQEKLAELIGKSRNYIGMVERAELNISITALFDFADTLDVEPKTFFEF